MPDNKGESSPHAQISGSIADSARVKCKARHSIPVLALCAALLLSSCGDSSKEKPAAAPATTAAVNGVPSAGTGTSKAVPLDVLQSDITTLLTNLDASMAAATSPLVDEPEPGRNKNDVAGIRSALLQGIDDRTAKLAVLATAVDSSQWLNNGQTAGLRAEVEGHRIALDALAADARSAGDVGSLRALSARLIDEHRIMSVEVPKVYVTIALAAADAGVARLSDAVAQLDQAVRAVAATGVEVKDKAKAIGDAKDKLEKARAALDGRLEKILNSQATEFASAKTELNGAIAALKTAAPALTACGTTSRDLAKRLAG